jgi:hypothetical protein
MSTVSKLPSLELKTRPIQLLDSHLSDKALPNLIHCCKVKGARVTERCGSNSIALNREPLLKGKLSTVDLLALTSLDHLLLILQTLLTFFAEQAT